MISIITPVHESGARFLGDAFRSLQGQTCQDWEWVIVENNGGRVPDEIRRDTRVKVTQLISQSIGALKRHATDEAQGDLVLELDCDDELAPAALERTIEAFAKGADFVYSDCAYWKDLGSGEVATTWQHYPFGAAYGWDPLNRYEVTHPRGFGLIAQRACPVTPHNLRRIEWSPDHLRAWRVSAYQKAGGHAPNMQVGDDHDLMVRMFLAGARFEHVPECLYFYRVHGQNAVALQNGTIQTATQGVYDANIWALAERFARDKELSLIDLCGAIDTAPGYAAIDVLPGGIQCDLNGAWDLPSNSVGVLRAVDAVEHLKDSIHTMNEAFRVLAPGGFFMVSVPSSNGMGAFCDPTHVSYWNRLSFRYYSDPNFMRYVPRFQGRFQVARLRERFPSDWHRENSMPYVEAHLIKLGAGYKPMGAIC